MDGKNVAILHTLLLINSNVRNNNQTEVAIKNQTNEWNTTIYVYVVSLCTLHSTN